MKLKNIVTLIFIAFIVLLGFASTDNHENGYNVSSTNLALNTDTSLGIFRDLTSSEIVDYYSTLSTGDKGDALLGKLQTILKMDKSN